MDPNIMLWETAPHPLDACFATTDKAAILKALTSNPAFLAAIDAAIEAIKLAEEGSKVPGRVGSSPTHAGRAAFLAKLA